MADRNSQLKPVHGLIRCESGERGPRRTSSPSLSYSMKTASAILAIAVAVLSSLPLLESQTTDSKPGARRALLVGIDQYQQEGTKAQHPAGCQGGRCDLPVFGNLDGSLNDVAAMRDLLASPKFGFEAKNIAVLTDPGLPVSSPPYVTLPASQTTHDGLLAAMQMYLVDVPQPGV